MPRGQASQALVNAVVQDVINEQGHEAAIPMLLQTLRSMAEITLADPTSKAKDRQYRQWLKAVKAVCKEAQTFEQCICDADAIRARGMGIKLD